MWSVFPILLLLAAFGDVSHTQGSINATLCGGSNETRPFPNIWNLDPSVEDVIPEKGFTTDVEVNYYKVVDGIKQGQTQHASETHNMKVNAKDDSLDIRLTSSRVLLRYSHDAEKEDVVITNFRTKDEQGNVHAETFVVSWDTTADDKTKSFKPCETFTDDVSKGKGYNNIPPKYWPGEGWIPAVLLQEDSSSEEYKFSVGPSALLLAAREDNSVKYNGSVDLVHPQVSADIWINCLPGPGDHIVYYYFTKDEIPKPIKIVIDKNNGEEVYTITFHNFQVLDTNIQIDVPLRMGCERLNIQETDGSPAPSLPKDFFDEDFEIEMEVISWSGSGNFSSSSSSSVKYYHLNSFNMTSMTQTVLDVDKFADNSSDDDSVRYKERNVMDWDDLFQYKTNLETSKCEILQPEEIFNKSNVWDMLPPMTFFLSSKLYMFKKDLWTVKNPLTYMGRSVVRGIPCTVYERTFENIFVDELGQSLEAVVTQYFVDTSRGIEYENTFLINEAPLQLVITTWDGETQYINRQITVNVYKFKSGIIDVDTRTREFGITDCFDGAKESDWFQVQFASDQLAILEEAFLGASRQVKEAFREELGVAPNRLPVMDVDFNYDGFATISVQMLDRPRWNYLFAPPMKGRIKDSQYTRRVLLETMTQCARRCLDLDDCSDFSYCDDTLECSTFTGRKSAKAVEVEGSGSCLYYTMIASSIKIVNEKILQDLEYKINRGEFSINVDYNNGTEKYSIPLKGIKLTRGVDPGFGDWKALLPKTSNEDLSWINGYQIHAKKKKFLYNNNNDDMEKALEVGMKDCISTCSSDDRCHSVSYCSGQNTECIFTHKHGSEITENITEVNTECNIFSRNFLSDYETHPNIRITEGASFTEMVNTEDDCAKICTTRPDLECRSFDFCDNLDDVSETGSSSCLIHKYHIAVTGRGDKDTKKVSLDLNSTICTHYTKKYTADFKATRDHQFTEKVKFDEVVEATSLEGCAVICSDSSNSCNSFDFCEVIPDDSGPAAVPQRKCRLTTVKNSEIKPLVTSNKNCIVYSSDGEMRKRNILVTKSSSGGVAPVAVGLVSILFLVFGAVGGVFGYRWYKNRQNVNF